MSRITLLCLVLPVVQLFGCASSPKRDFNHDLYRDKQAELREVLASMKRDGETGNAQGLRDIHLRLSAEKVGDVTS